MPYAYFNIRVRLGHHSFVQTPHQALELLHNMLSHDPRFDLYDMEISEAAKHDYPIVVQEEHNRHNSQAAPKTRNVFD